MKRIFAVVLHYQDRKLTEKCLCSLAGMDKKGIGLEIVIVDNCSPEPIGDLKGKFPGVTFLQTKQNLGFAEGNNFGIKYCLEKKADYIFLLNNDAVADKSLIMGLFREAEKDPSAGILAPKIYFAPGYEYHRSRYKKKDQGRVLWYAGGLIDWQNVYASHRGVDELDNGQYDHQGTTVFASGCAMLIKKEVFERAGYFDSRYFLYLEDLEFCLRAKRAGFEIVYCPTGKVWHYNAGSSQVGGSLHDYFFTRNRLLFGLKYASFRTKMALLKESVWIFLHGRPWQKKGVVDYFQKKFGKGSWVVEGQQAKSN